MQFHGQACSATYVSYIYYPCCGPVLCSELSFHFALEFLCDSIFYFVSIISYSSVLELLISNFFAVASSEVLQCFRNNIGLYRDIWKCEVFEKTLLEKKLVELTEYKKTQPCSHCSGSSKGEKHTEVVGLCCGLAACLLGRPVTAVFHCSSVLMPQGKGS